jgi:hypothetical protein
VLELNDTFTLSADVYLSLPANVYGGQRFLFLNQNLSAAFNVNISIGQTGDRITYFNSGVSGINQISTMTNFLIFPQQPSTSQIGFGYIFEAIINPSTPAVIQ